jgi:hypothetical protein
VTSLIERCTGAHSTHIIVIGASGITTTTTTTDALVPLETTIETQPHVAKHIREHAAYLRLDATSHDDQTVRRDGASETPTCFPRRS